LSQPEPQQEPELEEDELAIERDDCCGNQSQQQHDNGLDSTYHSLQMDVSLDFAFNEQLDCSNGSVISFLVPRESPLVQMPPAQSSLINTCYEGD